MAGQIFRSKRLKSISSPEQLNDYLKVTKPAVWIVLIAVAVLLAGAFVWGACTYIGSRRDVKAAVENGTMTAVLENANISPDDIGNVMVISVAGEIFAIEDANVAKDGVLSVTAATDLDDGIYDATLEYKKTQILSFLFDGN